ncbi:unnamed protein product [Microthlaspi erraticum]|uniref:Zinc finger GRF-type domain-containing protein n=1 Tax=Microthlaspi erraticum TaxID=1685480 RepID=A0A6D2HLA6_9BRAS|nr:unnamed protein product [Microthlaspi erraticum]CAA7043025.1 unnamed protein product [Microthlaspi erraticum]
MVSLPTSSSSSYSLDHRLISDGEYGLSENCYCGGDVYLETSTIEGDYGRRFFVCTKRDCEGYHIRKLWDTVIYEEVQILHTEIKRLGEKTEEDLKRLGEKTEEALEELKDGSLITLCTDLWVAESEIVELKKANVELKDHVVQLKALVRLLNKKHGTVELTFVVSVLVLFLGLFTIWFK